MTKKGYPSDSTDAEWAFVVPYLTLISEQAPQRKHNLRRAYDALKYVVRTGIPWRFLPENFPPWATVYQQTKRWIDPGYPAADAPDRLSRLPLQPRWR